MQFATLNAEALAGLLAIDAGFADLPSDCSVERARLITGTVLALLLLAAWYPVRRFLRRVSTADARLIAGILAATVVFFLGDAWFTARSSGQGIGATSVRRAAATTGFQSELAAWSTCSYWNHTPPRCSKSPSVDNNTALLAWAVAAIQRSFLPIFTAGLGGGAPPGALTCFP